MQPLTVHKRLENNPMIGPFTIREFLLVLSLTILLMITIGAIDYYLYPMRTIYTLICPLVFLASATSAKVYIKSQGKNIFEFIISKYYPTSLESGTFKPKTK